MTDNYFKPAQHHKLPLKLALFGPSKSGKTFTALKLMRGIVGAGGKFAVVDTENRGSEEYQGDQEVGDFDIAAMAENFSPGRYAKIIADAVEFGYQGIVIDGISPAWDGPGGVQSIADANTQGQNKFSGWQVATPEHAKLLQAVLQCPVHLICTMRSKTEYVVEQGKPKKVGLKPVQRDGIEYEFRLLGEMDSENNLKITGRRHFQNRIIPNPGADLAKELLHYLGSERAVAEDAQAVRDAQDRVAEGSTAPPPTVVAGAILLPEGGGTATTAPPPTGTTAPATPATDSAPAPVAAGILMTDPNGELMQVPPISVAAHVAAGWTVIPDPTPQSSPVTLPAPSTAAAPATVIQEPAAAPASVSTPPPAAPSTPIASGGGGQETGTVTASPASAPGGDQAATPTPPETTTAAVSTNGTTATDVKLEAGQLQKIVELCQELATLKPDKGDSSWWLEWANRKANEEYHQDFSNISRDNAAGLIERIEKTKLALMEAP